MKGILTGMLVAGVLASAVGCGDPEVAKRVTDLEARMTAVESAKPSAPSAPKVDQAAEAAASKLFRAANKDADQLKSDDAKAKLAELKAKYGNTRVARQATRLSADLNLVGKDAGSLDTEKWLIGESSFNEGKATMVVFWEVWCPHCKREVPKLQKLHEEWASKGLNIVGVTKMTRGTSEETVMSFLKENNVSYPVAKEANNLSVRFGVKGIPAAAIVKDGKIVWRGHPSKVGPDMIKTLIDG